jgi:Ca2+-binding EF-hand superfamily protein
VGDATSGGAVKIAVSGLVGVVLIASALAYAGSPPTKEAYPVANAESYNAHFGNMDPNRDGSVNWQEFKAHFPKADEKTFGAIDLNTDGAIDHDEWHRFKAAHGLKHPD